MASSPLAGIILGHNAFFGVDHLSAARGSARAAYFAESTRILETIHEAKNAGAGGMMMSTHERATPLAALIADDASLARDFRIYPLLPYAQKFVTRANEVGMVNVVLETLSGTTLAQKTSMILKGGRAFVSKDINAVLSAAMQIELKPFTGLNVPAIFLHDAFTDLALAFGMPEVFEFYLTEIEKSYGAQGAFTTKNLPTLLARFAEWGLPAPLVMTHLNKAGYHMNPSREACEQAAAGYDVSLLAMGSLASGYLKPDEAYEYLAGVANVDGIVVGVSSPAHIQETFGAIRRHLPGLDARLAA